MCGIYGIIGGEGRPVSRDAMQVMAAALHHRGPDQRGMFHEDGVALGTNRLAIVDTEGGDQPIYGSDDTHVIVYNGEIYNHADIRRELEAKGRRFRTQSDTETVLMAFEEMGADCVERLNGMFAFAIWNRRTRRLFLARDRLGIKPLYSCRTADGFAFASEAKALLALVPGGAAADWTAIHRYLTFGYVAPDDCAFAGIDKFPAGHHVSIDAAAPAAALAPVCFWQPTFGDGAAVPDGTAVADIDELLGAAVGRELMSDVPLGVFLSGGLDSSAVAHYAAKRVGRELSSFALSFEEQTHDEGADARLVADHLGLNHFELRLTPDLARDGLRRVVDLLDEPFADSTVLPLLVLSEFARQQVKVVLTGWGGDEVFAGYPTLQAHRAQRFYRRLPAVLARRLIPAVVERLPVSRRYLSFEFKAKRFVRGVDLPAELQHFHWMGYFDDAAKRRLLRPEIIDAVGADTMDPVAASSRTMSETGVIDRIMHLDARFFLPGNGLFQADRMSMAASLEARVPLLNNDLLAYALPLPAALKMAGGRPKGLLRKALAPHLPRAILEKPKKGFGPPSSAWINSTFRAIVDDFLGEERVVEAGLFDHAEVSRLLDDHRRRRADHGRNIWALLSLQLWHERFIRGQRPVLA